MAIQFHDPNFKLACLDILLDKGYFAEDLAEILEIPDQEDEWKINPKRMQAFQELPITQAQLDEITAIGPDGGDDIYFHVFPNWSGEEKEFHIGSFDDLKLLRNLEKLYVFVLAMDGALDLSVLLNLPKLKVVKVCDDDYIAPDSNIEATFAELRRRGIEISL